MNHIDKLKSLAETIHYEEHHCPCIGAKDGRYPFVTISRETGAGGNSAAAAILEELQKREEPLYQGWQKLNQELCYKVAEDPKCSASLESLLSSEYRSYLQDILEQMVIGSAPQDVVHRKIFELIETFAYHGKVIVVGRGGFLLTRHLPLGVHIRLVAPMERRIQNIVERFKMNAAKAKEFILEQDKARERFVKAYFNQDVKNPELYDAVWNTGTVPLNAIASAVADLVDRKACVCKQKKQEWLTPPVSVSH